MFEQFLNLQFVVLNHLPASPGEVVGHHRRLNPCGHSQTTRRRHHPYLLLVSSLVFNLNLNQHPPPPTLVTWGLPALVFG